MAFLYHVLWHLKSKVKQKYFDETVFLTILCNEKIKVTKVFLWINDPDLIFSRIRITLKDRIRIRNSGFKHLVIMNKVGYKWTGRPCCFILKSIIDPVHGPPFDVLKYNCRYFHHFLAILLISHHLNDP